MWFIKGVRNRSVCVLRERERDCGAEYRVCELREREREIINSGQKRI